MPQLTASSVLRHLDRLQRRAATSGSFTRSSAWLGQEPGRYHYRKREVVAKRICPAPNVLAMGCRGIKAYSRPRSGRARKIYEVSPIALLGCVWDEPSSY
jgi:hypothetical protein